MSSMAGALRETRAPATVATWRFALLCCAVACASAPSQENTDAALRSLVDNLLGLHLASRIEPELAFKRADGVSELLVSIAQNLASRLAAPPPRPVEVRLASLRGGNRWMSFALPSHRIYLSPSSVASARTESELAAVVAIQMAHVGKRHLVQNFERYLKMRETDRPVLDRLLPSLTEKEREEIFGGLELTGEGGVFEFDEKQLSEAVELAVELLYKGNYDPRGVVEHLAFLEARRAEAPLDPRALARLGEQAYRKIAGLAPLRNPVIRSERFIEREKEIRSL